MRQLGPCRSGCGELDDHVLLSGGFERGSVVGVSAEDDGMGLAVGLSLSPPLALFMYIMYKRTNIVLYLPSQFSLTPFASWACRFSRGNCWTVRPGKRSSSRRDQRPRR